MYYYNIDDDLKKYPGLWCYIIIGGRNTGKTYSCLRSCMENNIKFVFVKRTIEDVKLLCSGSGKIGTRQNEYGVDLSPFKSINRDYLTNIKAFSIADGLGGFWRCTEDDDGNSAPVGEPIGYIIALTAVTKFKGFDLSDSDWLIFDEFIPQPWDRVNRKEGEQLLDLYKTISRDREHRGKEPLKMICLANATKASNPVMNVLEIVDRVVDMELKAEAEFYDQDRGIYVHRIIDNDDFMQTEKQSMIYKAMGDTAWGRMALENKFGYDDFSNVGKLNVKGFVPVVSIKYKNKMFYIYQKNGLYYMTRTKNNHAAMFNLNTENGQKYFYTEHCIFLRNECIEGNMVFESYSMYDLIVNYKQFFKI